MANQEVERYTFWAPGQANAYFYGYMRLRELRDQVEKAMGSRFNPRAFTTSCWRRACCRRTCSRKSSSKSSSASAGGRLPPRRPPDVGAGSERPSSDGWQSVRRESHVPPDARHEKEPGIHARWLVEEPGRKGSTGRHLGRPALPRCRRDFERAALVLLPLVCSDAKVEVKRIA